MAREFIAAGANLDHQDNVSTYIVIASKHTLRLTIPYQFNCVSIAGRSDGTDQSFSI